jgi:O-methyltransferase
MLRHPKRSAKRVFGKLQRLCAPLFISSPLHLQAQMDIHPKSLWHKADLCRSSGGFFPPNDGSNRTICNLEPWDLVRRDMLILLLRSIVERGVEGDLAELGVWRGATAKLIHHYLPERPLHLFDTFSGFDKRDVDVERAATGAKVRMASFSRTNVEQALRTVSPCNSNVLCHAGFFPKSIPPTLNNQKFAFVHLDCDLYQPMMAGLQFFYPRTNPGGFIVVHDYNAWQGARSAVDTFLRDKNEIAVPMPDKSGSVVIAKL